MLHLTIVQCVLYKLLEGPLRLLLEVLSGQLRMLF